MILDPRPKTRREELYGRREELSVMRNMLLWGREPIFLISGLKRIGKTSIMLVTINELQGYDGRYVFLYFEAWRLTRRGQLGAEMARRLGLKPSEDPAEVLLQAGGSDQRIIVVIDEPQQAPRRVRKEFIRLGEAIARKAYYYSSLLLVSSAPGLVIDFMGFEKPGAPPQYRVGYSLWVKPLKRDAAEAMLIDGLREHGVTPDPDTVSDAVDFFGGIPGWLVFFGLGLLEGMKPEQIYHEAVQIALDEIKQLAPRPQLVLKVLAEGNNSWTEAIRALEDLEERIVSDNGFAKALRYLEKRALVKDYRVLDPVYARAARILDPREPLAQLGLAPEPRSK